jgi:hypothetical protein
MIEFLGLELDQDEFYLKRLIKRKFNIIYEKNRSNLQLIFFAIKLFYLVIKEKNIY